MKRWVIATVLLCGLCHTAAFAFQYDRTSQTQAWGYQPVYATPTVPAYEFYSTSPRSSTIMEAKSGSFIRRNVKSSWDDPDGDEQGVVPDPTPIGDAPWWLMFLLAAAYSAFRHIRQRTT